MNLSAASWISGIAGTAVMLAVLYTPRLWRGLHYDTVGALGSIFFDIVDARSRSAGMVLLFAGGVLSAYAYGWTAKMFLQGPFLAPDYGVLAGSMNLFYPLFGFVLGLCQGVFVSLITTFVVTDHHPLERYRQAYPLVVSFIVGHCVYGTFVMLLQSVLL